ncbi:HAD family hydrolase [Microbacterium horticulturae]|uniref:HAD family hydrolase n=1 Tax=Microbacterium horticulturae TaxID=3028316 RepID=A0ABY8C0H1_9MICO|nr:HAD family hydrolase [Microbacterium sp. KACC 23027]WEG08353.1 HAD family hydrolase [Microbacterium sp. KACC 23027]
MDAAAALYVSDLDFTLLRSDATLSARTVEVLNRLVADGVPFTYATARSYLSSRRVTAALDLALPLVTYGGTVIADPHDGAPLHVEGMPPEVVTTILDAARDVGIEPIVYAMEGGRDRVRWHAESSSSGVRWYVAHREGDPRLAPLRSWNDVDAASIFYITLIDTRERLEALRTDLAEALAGCAHFLSLDGYMNEHWLEIHADTGTKARAVRRLAGSLSVERIVAFGDNHNDVPLFEVADETCAVANAVPELRAIATHVIGANDADGVADWLAARFAPVVG